MGLIYLKGIEVYGSLDGSIKIESIKLYLLKPKNIFNRSCLIFIVQSLLNCFFEQPYTRILNLEKAGIAKRQTASKYLKELCDIGVLSEISLGRDKLFIHPKLMSLLRGENNEFTPYI